VCINEFDADLRDFYERIVMLAVMLTEATLAQRKQWPSSRCFASLNMTMSRSDQYSPALETMLPMHHIAGGCKTRPYDAMIIIDRIASHRGRSQGSPYG
jgi:hypothetical protein